MPLTQDGFVAESSLGRSFAGFSTLNNDLPGLTIGADVQGTRFGVQAQSDDGTGVSGSSKSGTGVQAQSHDGTGVSGKSKSGTGVLGQSDDGTGVSGTGATTGVRGQSVGGKGFVETAGVLGENDAALGIGVLGRAGGSLGHGVHGRCPEGTAVYAETDTGTALFAAHNGGPKGAAGIFFGEVSVVGPLVVVGTKSAAVPHPDGTHRLLYCVESPEAWFEDFGEAELVKGRATVRIAPDFAAVADVAHAHVYLTPYGDSRGLYVAARRRQEFVVREQGGGSSSLAFSYRIVARRKDVTAERSKVVTIPVRPGRSNPSAPNGSGRRAGRPAGARPKKKP